MKMIHSITITALALAFSGINAMGQEEKKDPSIGVEEETKGKGAGKGKGGKGGMERPDFKTLDLNGDKKISREEFGKAPLATTILENRGKEAVDKIFAMRDKDDDGTISVAEYNTTAGGGKGKGAKGKGIKKGGPGKGKGGPGKGKGGPGKGKGGE